MKGVHTIPELRRSFEYIEEFVHDMISQKVSHEKMSKRLRKEWHNVFKKELDKKSADAYLKNCSSSKRNTRHFKGGSALAGAPLEYTTRAGSYLQQGSIPSEGYGSYTDYVGKGFFNPEMAINNDPVKGQSDWPVPYHSAGSNIVHTKGGSRKANKGHRRKLRKGGGIIETTGALLSQAFMHPIPSSSPPSILSDMQRMAYGQTLPQSPDQVQRQPPPYLFGSLYPKAITV